MATDKKTDTEQQKRRKIVKGIAGLPALVTLASGSGAANASTLQCVQTDKDRPLPTVPARADCVGSDNLQSVGIDIFVEKYDDDTLDVAVRDSDGCLVYIDGNGEIASPSQDYVVTLSCYTSFATSATNTAIKNFKN